ncbi:MAG: hypothetical protein A9Z00_15410 [Thermobacillus sp. ZCTH02-B1]|uniref:DUF1934 domain-containing protein n=1 Tax=Thermobacillus sp. ZCTH02-B1 TaxID=1858795 RepID=UPI000B55716E|nr:DUF1934 domain-containing protein [Thermobacillus sp. ZCTH02-B1]OUM95664.1 MAG: hypothetical protein A9Z00_15410 [Thermobacillus sp. ZCTH02-B1]
MEQMAIPAEGIGVRIELESRQDGGEAARSVLAGRLYARDGALFLRYEEEGGRTRSLLRWDGRTLRLVRTGEIESAQTFDPGAVTGGYFRTPLGRFDLRMRTHRIQARADGPGLPMAWSWAYRLEAGGADAGEFVINLVIREDTHDE